MERDPTSSGCCGEGLVNMRIDELLPYIGQGYEDVDTDAMENIMTISS